jgi:hypothetical protein
VAGSKPATGSSTNSTGGEATIARAIPTRFRIPCALKSNLLKGLQGSSFCFCSRHTPMDQRQLDILQNIEGIEQGIGLKNHSDTCLSLPPVGRIHAANRFAIPAHRP